MAMTFVVPSRAFGRGAAALFAALCLLLGAGAAPGRAQTVPAAPDQQTLARLVWSTMVALDNANRTGYYGVLYSLGSPQFQRLNSADSLSDTFAVLRRDRIDVGRAILAEPTWYLTPAVDPQTGLLRLRGGFEFRPRSLRFDLLYMQVDGGWRLHGISVIETSMDAPR